MPFYGVPESLLSDRGTNLLSHLMMDLCKMLVIKKLNTTAYQLECDGMVERFNLTLKYMLRKHTARFNKQWDRFLPGVLLSYRNNPNESRGRNHHFYCLGLTCIHQQKLLSYLQLGRNGQFPMTTGKKWSPPCHPHKPLQLNPLSKHKRGTRETTLKGPSSWSFDLDSRCWCIFPKRIKLSQPWHGPYRVVSCDDPNIAKVYFPDEGTIQVHQSRVCICPVEFPAGYYWYGSKCHSDGTLPRWIQRFLADQSSDVMTHDGPRHNLNLPPPLPRNRMWTLRQRSPLTVTSCVPTPSQMVEIETSLGRTTLEEGVMCLGTSAPTL